MTRNHLLKRNLLQNHQLETKLEADWTTVISSPPQLRTCLPLSAVKSPQPPR
ncbi:hypothetical protein HJG60_009507 [Phyllostomus discolor]|uniref:Uncharacterized protein n=1 Tax=Phyllostomus discolor TaxID=89673 RepID=A0A833YKZ0_9CHIR|nr:hypothetical protein HJG60_009507 [Phyllostomus discolor]